MSKTIDNWITELYSEDKKIWREAVRALGYLGNDAVAPVLDTLHDENVPWERIAEILKQIGQPAVDALSEAILSDEDVQARIRMAKVIGAMKDVRLLTALIDGMSDADALVRETIADAMSNYNDPRAVNCLLQGLNDEFPNVRASAARALGSYSRDPRVESPLLQALNDLEPQVRAGAAKGLAYFKSDSVKNALEVATSDPHEDVRQTAAAALQLQAGDKMVFARLNRQSDDITNTANLILKKIEEDGVFDENDMDAMRHSNPVIRSRLLEVLSETGQERAFSLIMPALNDINPAVRRTGVDALVRMGDVAVPLLIKNLNDKSKFIRAGLVEALGMLRDEQVLVEFEKMVRDDAVMVRVALVNALNQFTIDESTKILKSFLKDDDREVKELAEKYLAERGVSDNSGAMSRFFRRLRGN